MNNMYHQLATAGHRVPIGTHLVLAERPNHDALLLDGRALGSVVIESARRYRTPLAFPLMDLMVEKEDLLTMLGVAKNEIDSYHFNAAPGEKALELIRSKKLDHLTPRMKANLDALTLVSKEKSLVAVGMVIGPFSLMTKLLADPITPVFLAGSGSKAGEDPEVALVEWALEASTLIVERSLRLQARAGARAICMCEPAANKVYVSPNQIESGSDVWERVVMKYNRRLRKIIDEVGIDLILHDCGELTDAMVASLASLKPKVLSLGSPRKLWEVEPLIPRDIVMFGNLPTKKFYSDDVITLGQVKEQTCDLVRKMKATGHAFIVGSECDVLSVPGCEMTIKNKVGAMLGCAC